MIQRNLQKHLRFLLLLLFLTTIVGSSEALAQQATAISSGVTFNWDATTPQTNQTDPTVIESITINGLDYDQLVVPDGYVMTQLGQQGNSNNRIRTNGSTYAGNATVDAAWNAAALAAFQDFNLNKYFESNQNGQNICQNNTAYLTTYAQKQTLIYNKGIPSTPGAIVAVTERNANNCFYIELYGTPADGSPDTVLGGTWVRPYTTSMWGAITAAPTNTVDYWLCGRRNNNNGTIGIALFYLSEIAPLNSVVRQVTLTAATYDHGDGKFFIASRRSELTVEKLVDNEYPHAGDTLTFTINAANGTGPGIYEDTSVSVRDSFPSGLTFVSATPSVGTYNDSSGIWDVGSLMPGASATLTVKAIVHPGGDHVNTVFITGGLYDVNSGNNVSSAIPSPIIHDPDYNVTFVHEPILGDVGTNDDVPPGTTYGTTAQPLPGNPSGATLIMDPSGNGEYTFEAALPGVYYYDVEVCAPLQNSPCPTEVLEITVTDPNADDNKPVTNIDQSSVEYNSTIGISINVKENDGPGNVNGSLGIPTAGNLAPSNGSISIDPMTGEINYIPNPDFIGTDTFSYEICDTVSNPAVCDTSIVIVDVLPPGANAITAVDDYNTTTEDVPVTANVLNNDTDPNGDTYSATPVTTPTPVSGGTYTIAANGEYTFTPNPGFSGPTSFEYEVCDDQGLCEKATVYITVSPGPETDPDMNVSFVNMPIQGDLSTNDDVSPGTTYGNPTALTGNPDGSVPVIDPETGEYTFNAPTLPGVYQFDVEVCPAGQSTGCPTEILTITVLDSASTENPPVANVDIGKTPMNTAIEVNLKENDNPSSQGGLLGDPSLTGPNGGASNGTATINSDGELIYTPNSGFIGLDTVYYEICDTVLDPAKCEETMAIIEVFPTGENHLEASDDYNQGVKGSPIIGNALINDNDPNMDQFTATQQTAITLVDTGTFLINPDGSYQFVPDPDFIGSVNFPYEICDAQGLCTEATIYLLVSGANLNPADIFISKFRATSFECAINLSWTVVSTENADEIILERSDRGDQFITIDNFDIPANSNNMMEFRAVDASVKAGNSYFYRLKLVDLDGSYEYSYLVRVENDCNGPEELVEAFPNPSRDIFNIQLKGLADRELLLDVYDLLGRMVSHTPVDVTDDVEVVELDLSSLAPGQYHLNVRSDKGYSENIKLLIVR